VISLEEINLDPSIHKALESRENPNVPLGHDIAVLIPEIPDISQKIKSLSILRQSV
jgi:hypothetical protein